MTDTDSNEDRTAGADGTEVNAADAEAKLEDYDAEEKTDDGKEDTKVVENKPTLDDILNDPLVKEHIDRQKQSERDRALAQAQKSMNAERKRLEREAAKVAEQDEYRKLLESGEDGEREIGRRRIQQVNAEAEERKFAEKFSQDVETDIRSRYEGRLTPDTIDRVFNEIKNTDGGTVVDFAQELAKEERREAVEAGIADSEAKWKANVAEEVQAQLTQKGLANREDDVADGKAAPAQIEKKQAASTDETAMTYSKASEMFGAGTMSRKDFLPWLDKHNKERQ